MPLNPLFKTVSPLACSARETLMHCGKIEEASPETKENAGNRAGLGIQMHVTLWLLLSEVVTRMCRGHSALILGLQ